MPFVYPMLVHFCTIGMRSNRSRQHLIGIASTLGPSKGASSRETPETPMLCSWTEHRISLHVRDTCGSLAAGRNNTNSTSCSDETL